MGDDRPGYDTVYYILDRATANQPYTIDSRDQDVHTPLEPVGNDIPYLDSDWLRENVPIAWQGCKERNVDAEEGLARCMRRYWESGARSMCTRWSQWLYQDDAVAAMALTLTRIRYVSNLLFD